MRGYGREYRRPASRRTVGEMGEWRGGAWVWHGDRSDPLQRYDERAGYRARRRPDGYDLRGGYTAQRSAYGGWRGGWTFGTRRYDAGYRRG